jgi:hypothetical protein
LLSILIRVFSSSPQAHSQGRPDSASKRPSTHPLASSIILSANPSPRDRIVLTLVVGFLPDYRICLFPTSRLRQAGSPPPIEKPCVQHSSTSTTPVVVHPLTNNLESYNCGRFMDSSSSSLPLYTSCLPVPGHGSRRPPPLSHTNSGLMQPSEQQAEDSVQFWTCPPCKQSSMKGPLPW